MAVSTNKHSSAELDPGTWLDRCGDLLFGYTLTRVRDKQRDLTHVLRRLVEIAGVKELRAL